MATQLLLGTRKGLLQLEKQNGEWQFVRESFRATPVSYAMRDPRTQTLWACLDHGHWGAKLHRSTDDGVTWQEIPLPRFPESSGATLSYLWLVMPGGIDQPNRLYLGTEPAGLFRSDDGGATFTFVESLWNQPERSTAWFGGGRAHAGLCSLVVDPRDSRHLIAGVSVGGVYESHDDGETWQARNQGLYADYLPDPHAAFGHDPHYMLASPSNPDVLWQQNHCGVYRSTNSAATWENISQPNGPVYYGFAIAVDAQSDQTAWVVPAIDAEFRVAVDRSLTVCRTEDGGATWQELRNGLPQAATYDIVLRHALDVRGDTLAFGSTTGNLYLSETRGDAWQCLGNNFPPINSVRFG
jgi:hypothetical protein